MTGIIVDASINNRILKKNPHKKKVDIDSMHNNAKDRIYRPSARCRVCIRIWFSNLDFVLDWGLQPKPV